MRCFPGSVCFAMAMASSAPAHAAPSLEVVVLGSGGPRAFGRAGTSYLVVVDGTPRALVDAGPGAFLQLGKLGIDLSRVDVVLLTHLHIDHTGDLPALFLARSLTSDGPIVFRVFGPAGATGFPSTSQLVHLLFDAGGAFEYQRGFAVTEDIRVDDVSTDLAAERELVSDDGLRVRAIATHHGNCPSVAYRIDYNGESVTFAGDMDASALGNLERLATGSDLLVMHLAVLDPPGSPDLLYTLHTAPKPLGAAAQRAGARRLLLSHLAPAIESNLREALRSVSASYRGAIVVARDGLRVPVRAPRARSSR